MAIKISGSTIIDDSRNIVAGVAATFTGNVIVGSGVTINSTGVIADQVEKILPELVHGDDPKTVNYNGLIGLLIETVKEQQNQIDELNNRISKLEWLSKYKKYPVYTRRR